MFRKHTRPRQIPLTGPVDELPEPLRERLRNSWAETSYREFFCRLNEVSPSSMRIRLPVPMGRSMSW